MSKSKPVYLLLVFIFLGSCNSGGLNQTVEADVLKGCLSEVQVSGLNYLVRNMERYIKRFYNLDSTRDVYQMLIEYHANYRVATEKDPFYDIGYSEAYSWLKYDSSNFYHDVNVFLYDAERRDTELGVLAIGGRSGPRHFNAWRVGNKDSQFAQCLIKNNTVEKLTPLLEVLPQPIALDKELIAKRLIEELTEEEWDDPVLHLYIAIYFYYNPASSIMEIAKVFDGG